MFLIKSNASSFKTMCTFGLVMRLGRLLLGLSVLIRLIFRNNTFYLYVTTEVPECDRIIPKGVFGVDLSIVNIAVDSDNTVHNEKHLNQRRDKLNGLKSRLQKFGTKSAKRHLKKLLDVLPVLHVILIIEFPRKL